ncbi:MAG: glycosyltransferase family 4 protein [Elusimicrobiales bacterium]|nr:glycosyltransferase family 4 protein [Elusimicrobiales bacterium]
MKVLHITESNGFSGGGNQSLYLARLLQEKGIEDRFACPQNSVLKEKAQKEFIFFDFKPDGNFDLKTLLSLKKLFEEEKFDIIHAHHPKAHNYSFWAKRISKFKPFIVVSRRVSHPIPENFLVKTRYKSKHINAYIAVCENVKKILLDYGIDEKKIYVIYSGVDKKRFYKRPKDLGFKKSLGLDENDFVISQIGNFSSEKGQIFTLKAAKILIDKGYRFKLLFAGMRTEKEEIKKIAEQENIPPNYCVFLGLRNDVEKILNISDISVNSSVKGEALSGSIRESLACGVPVVASDISGNGEIVKNGENGFLFSPGNYAELSQKIEELMKNEKLRDFFCEKALKTVDEKFTVEKMAEETLKVYLRILKK